MSTQVKFNSPKKLATQGKDRKKKETDEKKITKRDPQSQSLSINGAKSSIIKKETNTKNFVKYTAPFSVQENHHVTRNLVKETLPYSTSLKKRSTSTTRTRVSTQTFPLPDKKDRTPSKKKTQKKTNKLFLNLSKINPTYKPKSSGKEDHITNTTLFLNKQGGGNPFVKRETDGKVSIHQLPKRTSISTTATNLSGD